MSEQFRFDQFARNGRHVDGHEGALAAAAIVMQRPRHKLLARTGLSHDHDREIGLRQAGDDAVDFLHRRRAADNGQSLARRIAVGWHRLRRLFQGPSDRLHQGIQVKRLGQIIVSAALRRRDGRHDRVLGAHHDDRKIRSQFLDARQHVKAFSSGSTTSVTTASPCPSDTQRHRADAVAVDRTL